MAPTNPVEFVMPIIMYDQDNDYNTIMGTTTVAAVDDPAKKELKITLSEDDNTNQLYAITSGALHYYPSGSTLPNGDIVGEDVCALRIKVISADLKNLVDKLPPGIPLMAEILIFNVDEASFINDIEKEVQTNIAFFSDAYLKKFYPTPASTSTATGTLPTRVELETNFITSRMLDSTKFIPINFGTKIGKASLNGTTPEFILKFIDGAANDLSPLGHIKTAPLFAGDQWNNHPLIATVENMGIPVDIYLKFEIWKKGTPTYVSLPNTEGIKVKLMDYDPDPILDDDEIAEKSIGSDGRVHFSSSDIPALLEEGLDLYFLVKTPNGKSFAGHSLPEEWSTQGWESVDGKPGYYEDFGGTLIGNNEKPLVFTIGLDLHIKLRYVDNNGNFHQAPEDTTIFFKKDTPLRDDVDVMLLNLKTDLNGEINNIIFDILPGTSLFFHIPFEMEIQCKKNDGTIEKLKNAKVNVPHLFTNDNNSSSSLPNLVNWSKTTLSETIIVTADNNQNSALFMLSVLREFWTFLYYITKGEWKGVEDLTFYPDPIGTWPYSWPIGEVNIPKSWHWKRNVTIIHELAHQVMWKISNYTSLGILYEISFGQLYGDHNYNVLINQEHALMEGWADFCDILFDGNSSLRAANSIVKRDKTPVIISKLQNNWGESVEGKFSFGLLKVFQNVIVGTSGAVVTRSDRGEAGDVASWINTSAVQDNFIKTIWEPLKDLADVSNPTTTSMLVSMKNNVDRITWNSIITHLRSAYLAMLPIINSILPNAGPVNSEQEITIKGANFVYDAKVVTGIHIIEPEEIFNETDGTGTSISVIKFILPVGLAVGPIDISVETLGGKVALTGGYNYV